MHPYFSRLTPAELNKNTVLTGSIGPVFDDFRYRIRPDSKEGRVYAAAYSVYCYEKAEDKVEAEFSYDDEGVEALKSWLQEQYDGYISRKESK